MRKVTGMKLVLAVIRPSDVEAVTRALREAGVGSLTLSRVRFAAHIDREQGGGTASAPATTTGGPQYAVPLEEIFRLEAAVKDSVATDVVNAMLSVVRKGQEDKGKGSAAEMPEILVLDLKDVVRVRTEERGDEVL